MITESHIVRLAMSRLGAVVRDPEGAEASHARVLYPLCRDLVLRAHDWAFARVREELVDISTDDGDPATVYAATGGWAYRFKAPLRMAAMRRICIPDYDEPQPYQLEVLSAYDNRTTVLCDLSECEAVYTAKIEDPSRFDDAFIEALSWKLAADCAMPITRDAKIRNDCYQFYVQSLGAAMGQDKNSERARAESDASWVSGRG